MALPSLWSATMHGHLCPLSDATQRAIEQGFATTRANVQVSVSLLGGAPTMIDVDFDNMMLGDMPLWRESHTMPEGSVAFWDDAQWQPYHREHTDIVLSALLVGRTRTTVHMHGFRRISISVSLVDARGPMQTSSATGRPRPLRIDRPQTMQLPPALAWHSGAVSQAPAEYVCSITQEPMKVPVVAADGHTYEYDAIRTWFRKNTSSPKTGQSLSHKDLVVNWALRGVMESCLASFEKKTSSTGTSSASSSEKPLSKKRAPGATVRESKKASLGPPTCSYCAKSDRREEMVFCENGCPVAVHVACYMAHATVDSANDDDPYYCSACEFARVA